MTLLTSWHTRRTARAERWADAEEADRLAWAWRQACEGAGCFHRVDTPSGPTISTPHLTSITLGPPVVLIARLLPGQVAADVARIAHRLAGHLGAAALQVEARGLEYVRVQLLDRDPLAELVPLVLPRPALEVLVGRGEDGVDLLMDWRDAPHAIVQGVTRSGKSVWTYGLLAQLAPVEHVLVAGVDPTGLLWRPFAGSRHAKWQTSGLRDLEAHTDLLGRLVDEMDQRITDLPAHRDTLDVHAACPLLVVVLEEYPGLLRAVDAEDPKRGKRVRALVSRLLAEGAKVGIRLVILAQRAEAAVVGAFERAMCSLRISFRTDNRASVELLHPGALPELADAHTIAGPGIALVSAPGRPLARMRGPWLGDYGHYAAAVAGD